MKWNSRSGFLLALFLVLSSIVLSQNVSAATVLDSYTIDSSVSSFYLCSSSSASCSDYSYVLFTVDSVATTCSIAFNYYIPPLTRSINLSTSSTDNFVLVPVSFIQLQYNSYYCNTSSQSSDWKVSVYFYDANPFASDGITPSGSLSITANGTYDVTNYAEAVVDVPETVVEGDYHDDLVNIYHAIMICGGVILVLYFFYCIYRLIIKSTGGW